MTKEDREDFSKKVHARVKAAMDNAKDHQDREMFRKRIEIAKKGLAALSDGKALEAVMNFKTYLKILEDSKHVGEHGLGPHLFDKATELPEMLLISGVYWDLTKIYDRSSSAESKKEFKIYLNKFVVFSKGMTFQPVSAETLRKYIFNGKCQSKDDFREAYKKLANTKCFIATTLDEWITHEELQQLREVRDEVLNPTFLGRVFVRGYYAWGPSAARVVEALPRFARGEIARVILRLGKGLSKNRSHS